MSARDCGHAFMSLESRKCIPPPGPVDCFDACSVDAAGMAPFATDGGGRFGLGRDHQERVNPW
jgi:hypothetical protein